MKIGLDLDGCVYPFSLVTSRVLQEVLGYPYLGEWQCWDYPIAHGGVTPEDWDWIWSPGGKALTFGAMDTYPGGAEFMQTLGTEHELTIVTHRSHKDAHLTFRWLAHHKVPAQGVHILPNSKPKSEIVNALGLELFIDDKDTVIADVLSNTNALVWSPRRPWNADFVPPRGTEMFFHRYETYEEVLAWLTTL